MKHLTAGVITSLPGINCKNVMQYFSWPNLIALGPRYKTALHPTKQFRTPVRKRWAQRCCEYPCDPTMTSLCLVPCADMYRSL